MTPFLAVQQRDPVRLGPPLVAGHAIAGRYHPPEGLVEAIDVAMLLGEPLVLTGAPGAGKTQAARWLAHELEVQPLLRFDVKSTSSGADLLYSFDDVGRFRDASAGGQPKPLIRYLRFNALGEGILRALGGDAVLTTASRDLLDTPEALARNARLLREVFGEDWSPRGGAVRAADLAPDEPTFAAAEGKVRVVLIDELDKAPRDTPNDLLAEVESMTFLIPELGLRVVDGCEEAAREAAQRRGEPYRPQTSTTRPVVIITSNSEKALPEPFLRRCAYFDVPFPSPDLLARIIQESVAGMAGSNRLAGEAIEVVSLLRREERISRKPGTAELLAWTETLVSLCGLQASHTLKNWIPDNQPLLASSLAALLKQREDQQAGRLAIARWAGVRDGPLLDVGR